MKLDETLQKQILEQLREAYPDTVDFQSQQHLQPNLFYLRDRGLIEATESKELGSRRILWANITASGLDFLLEYQKERKSASVVTCTPNFQEERRRQDLERGLQAARCLQRIHPDVFAQQLNMPDHLPLTDMEAIESLCLLTRHIKDPDCRSYLLWLCNIFDSVSREKSQVRINEKEVQQTVKTLQDRIQWFIDDTREELSKGGTYKKVSSSVFSLHGIRTRGVWQKTDLTPVLTEAGFIHVPLDYDHFAFWKLLIRSARQRKIEGFLKDYTEQTKHTNPHSEPPSIIAHSFGTYIVTEALRRYPEIRFTNIILCGSIVSRDFPWSKVIEEGRVERVLNERAKRDLWVRLVPYVVKDADSSGVDGFNDVARGQVIERHHPDWHHSEFFYRRHYLESWVPFLSGKTPGASGIEPPGKWNWRFEVVRAVVVVLLVALAILGIRFLPQHPT